MKDFDDAFLFRRGEVAWSIDDKRCRQRKRRHVGGDAANGAVGVAFVGVTARAMMSGPMMRCAVIVRDGNRFRRRMMTLMPLPFGHVPMMGVRIGGLRGCGGAFSGRRDDVDGKLILRGQIGDQRDRDKPRGKTKTLECGQRHGGGNLRRRRTHRKPTKSYADGEPYDVKNESAPARAFSFFAVSASARAISAFSSSM